MENDQIEKIKTILDKKSYERTELDVFNLQKITNKVTFFRQYIENQQQNMHKLCCYYMTYQYFSNNSTIFQIGSNNGKFYIILKGKVGVYIPVKPDFKLQCVKSIKEGESFGELALISNKPRLASIICHSDCHVALLDKKYFQSILKQSEKEKIIKQVKFFASIPFFQNWNFNLLKQLYLNSHRLKYIKNQYLFKQGDQPEGAYIVYSGYFTASKTFSQIQDEEKEETIDYLVKNQRQGQRVQQILIWQPFELFGEDDIVNKVNRQYSVQCSSVVGEVILFKVYDFINRIMQDESSKTLILERVKEKQKWFNKQINNVNNQLQKYGNYYFQNKALQEKIQKQSNFTKSISSQNFIQGGSIEDAKCIINLQKSENEIEMYLKQEKNSIEIIKQNLELMQSKRNWDYEKQLLKQIFESKKHSTSNISQNFQVNSNLEESLEYSNEQINYDPDYNFIIKDNNEFSNQKAIQKSGSFHSYKLNNISNQIIQQSEQSQYNCQKQLNTTGTLQFKHRNQKNTKGKNNISQRKFTQTTCANFSDRSNIKSNHTLFNNPNENKVIFRKNSIKDLIKTIANKIYQKRNFEKAKNENNKSRQQSLFEQILDQKSKQNKKEIQIFSNQKIKNQIILTRSKSCFSSDLFQNFNQFKNQSLIQTNNQNTISQKKVVFTNFFNCKIKSKKVHKK